MKTQHALDKRVSSLLKVVAIKSGLDSDIDRGCLATARLRFLQSHDVKMAYLGRLQPKASADELWRQSLNLDPLKPWSRPISYYEIPRVGRAPRTVCELPTGLKALHRAANALITAQFTPHPAIYNWAGRGRDRLVCDLRAMLEQEPSSWIVKADVRDCYPSINPDAIRDLQLLPEPFVEAALDVRQMRFRRKDRIGYGVCRQATTVYPTVYPVVTCEEQASLGGLMQGSPTSNALLAVFFNDLPSQVPSGVTPFVSSDNIIAVCQSQEVCSQVENVLGGYFSRHRAGSLVLNTEFKGEARDGFDFLGYRFGWSERAWRVEHSRHNLIGVLRHLAVKHSDPELTIIDKLGTLLSGFHAIDDQAVEVLVRILEEVN